MPRKKIPRRIPPLPKQPALRRTDHKAEQLLVSLRETAVSIQGPEPQLFYPMREVARQYKVPVSLVAKVYHELERDGILRRIRGSGTMLQGLSPRRKLTVRGIIAIASSLSCFITLQDYRNFLTRIRCELRRKDFAAAEVFFEPGDSADELAERLLECHPDTVICYCPDTFSKELSLRLDDKGIPIVGLSDGGLAAIHCQYEVRRSKAIKEMLLQWRKEGISKIKLGVGVRRSPADEERVNRAARETGLETELVAAGFHSFELAVNSLVSGPGSGTVLLHSAASLLATRSPESLAELTVKSRVGLIDGPVSIPFVKPSDSLFDILVVDWQAVARRMVGDLLRHKSPDREHPFVFGAEPVFRVPLSKYAQRV